jgi:electron transfer flavoprotein beta subunit
VARKLGWPVLTNVAKLVDITDGRITVERLVDGRQETVRCRLPAVISVSKEINEPRDPNIMGIRKANRAVIPVVTAGDLGIEAAPVRTQWTNLRKPEGRATAVRMIEGATAQEKVANLVAALLADKVI